MDMASKAALERNASGLAQFQRARIAEQGSASHPHCVHLSDANGPFAARDLADAVHLFCAIHGTFPGLADIAYSSCDAGPTRTWLRGAADAFERERLYLVRLTSAVGPLPSTPGAAATQTALLSQRHAIETLARSERRGCALGAATALIQDWAAVRPVLDRAAVRHGIESPVANLPDDSSIGEAMASGLDGVASERALAFGAEQMLLQHRALFDLLEARAGAREDF